MANINLIPEELRLDQIRRRRLRFWMIVVGCCLFVAAVWSGWQYHSYLRAKRAWREADSGLQSIEEKMQNVASAENLLLRWQGRLALQRRLNRYPDIGAVTGYLACHSPQEVYLSQLGFGVKVEETGNPTRPPTAVPKMGQMFMLGTPSAPITPALQPESEPKQVVADVTDGRFSLELKGRALQYRFIADLLNLLDQAGVFYQEQLRRAARAPGSADEVDFEIECIILPRSLDAGVQNADMRETENL